MISALDFSRGTKKAGYALDLPFKAPTEYFNKPLWVLSLDPATLAPPVFLDDVSKVMQPRPKFADANESAGPTFSLTPPSDWFVHLTETRSYLTDHVDRVADDHGLAAAVTCHDANAWSQKRIPHKNALHTVLPLRSPAPCSSTTIPEYGVATTFSRSSSSLMVAPNQSLDTTEPSPEEALLCVATGVCQRNSTPLFPPGLGIPLPHHSATAKEHSPEELVEGRRRTGEILVRCGVIRASGTSPTEAAGIMCPDAADASPVEIPPAPIIPGVNAELRSSNDSLLVTALANWAADWVYNLVLEPYLQRGYRFQYHGKPNAASASVALRIRRVISGMCNPAQVIIHALWFIGILAGDGTHNKDKIPFLGIPIFRYLHNNGAIAAEDFMFRTFVACAMIGDKSINDATFSTKTWSCLARIPVVVLNATESFALKGIKWNAVMTNSQWKETIVWLRSHIKMGSAFDPFGYDETSTSGIMVHLLDELISLSYADEDHVTVEVVQPPVEILAPQPVKHFSHWQVFDPVDWCPEDDPIVNQKPRTVGTAPGADHLVNNRKSGTTAKDLLDSILASSSVADLTYLRRPLGTSFCGSFGAIGARLAHTVRLAAACQNGSWFPA